MQTLQSYLKIDDASAPDALFARSQQSAREAVEQLAARVRRQPGGPLKERIVRAAARRVRLLMSARESPKFFAIRTMGIAREAFLDVAEEFAQDGTIHQADDLVFLGLDELEALARNDPRDWKALIAGRQR